RIGDAMNEDLAVFLELPHSIANILHAILGSQHGAPIDLLFDPARGELRFRCRQIRRPPLGTMSGKAFAIFTDCIGSACGFHYFGSLCVIKLNVAKRCQSSWSSRKSFQSSRFSLMISLMTSNRFSSMPSSWLTT